MNKLRRSKLSEATSLLETATTMVELIRDEEQNSHDNLPENLQDGQQAETMEEAIDELETAIDSMNDAISHIDRACNC